MKVRTESYSHKLLQCFMTFFWIDLAWIFFRANSFTEALAYIGRIATNMDPWVLFDGTIFQLGLSAMEFLVAIVSLFILFLVDRIRYTKQMQLYQYLDTQSLWFRWIIYIFLFCAILIFGIYGPSYDAAQFYYFQF